MEAGWLFSILFWGVHGGYCFDDPLASHVLSRFDLAVPSAAIPMEDFGIRVDPDHPGAAGLSSSSGGAGSLRRIAVTDGVAFEADAGLPTVTMPFRPLIVLGGTPALERSTTDE